MAFCPSARAGGECANWAERHGTRGRGITRPALSEAREGWGYPRVPCRLPSGAKRRRPGPCTEGGSAPLSQQTTPCRARQSSRSCQRMGHHNAPSDICQTGLLLWACVRFYGRGRVQTSLKVAPSSFSNRLALMALVKLGSSSVTER